MRPTIEQPNAEGDARTNAGVATMTDTDLLTDRGVGFRQHFQVGEALIEVDTVIVPGALERAHHAAGDPRWARIDLGRGLIAFQRVVA